MRYVLLSVLSVLIFGNELLASPSRLFLTNQFGEKSFNYVTGSAMPLVPGSSNIVALVGAGAPTDGVTGATIAAKGSFYFDSTGGGFYQNTGTKTVPAWSSASGTGITAPLTGYVSAPGTIAATDTILQAFDKVGAMTNYTPSLVTETVSAAGAVSTTKGETTVSNATGSSIAVTLAAPSSQDGQIKVIKMGTATSAVTLACTNIVFSGAYTPTGTTTLTFSISGQSAVFMAVGSKWVYLGGSAVAS